MRQRAPYTSIVRHAWALLFLCACTEVKFPATGSTFPAASTPSWAHQPRFAITDNRSDELSFVTDNNPMPALLGNLPVGDIPVELEGPHHLDASPDGRYIYYNLSNYVPGTGTGPHGSHGTGLVPGSLVKIDAATGEELGETLVDRSPGDVILSSDGKLAFVTHYDLIRVQAFLTMGGPPESAYSPLAIVDTATMTRRSMTPLCVTGHGEALSADQKTLYVTCAQSDQLAVVDVSDPVHPQVTLRLPVGPAPGTLGTPAYGPYALSVSPADGTVWISDNNSADVRVFDPATNQMDPARTVITGGVSMFSAFTSDGKTLYVPHQGDDKITVIDTATLATHVIPLPPQACLNVHLIKLAPAPRSTTAADNAIVICEGDHISRPGTAVMVSLAAQAVTGFVEVGLFPDGAVWLPPAP
jgi:DNA-binding beta-propeller fold protein YncE